MKTRVESDIIGDKELPKEVLYGIHSLRAAENFPHITPFNFNWYKSLGLVKQACYITYKEFINAAKQKTDISSLPIKIINDDVLNHLIVTSKEITEGKYFEHFVVPAIQGGAGTSINMNINEIIANASLIKAGYTPGNYNIIDPIADANIYQSTNDVVPTALKIAIIQLLETLEIKINDTRNKIENLENKYRDIIRIGYTQMQEAVPSSFGIFFSNYSDALSRDWWRVSKCFERIKTVNIGGSAIGTGITVPRFFIMEVPKVLQKLTNLAITRSENLNDATNNLDSFVEIHAILKAHAVTMEKFSSDIRLLASDIHGKGILSIPKVQAGSSIMPGKINPVICEYAISIAHKVYSNDNIITNLCGQGCLDLNAYIPIIGNQILESIELLIAANTSITNKLLNELTINESISIQEVLQSPVICTALIPIIGYHKAGTLGALMKKEKLNIIEANKKLQMLPEAQLSNLLQPGQLLKLGFTINDILT